MSYIHTDGVVYSDDKRTLIECPKELSSISILDSVTEIGVNAFWRSLLTSITIPDSVTEIGENPFSGCTALKEIRIPKGTKLKFLKFDGIKPYKDKLVEYEKETEN